MAKAIASNSAAHRSSGGFMSFLITPSSSIAIQENSSWRVELRAVLALALPVVLQTASQQAMLITDQMFLGRLGTTQMAAASIGNSWLNLMWLFLMGCSTALDTLGSQAYGAGDRTALITWCFTAFLVLTTLCVPVSVGLASATWTARVFFGQEEDVALLVGKFCAGLIPGMPPVIWTICLMKYLQTQNVMALPALVTVIAFFLNIAANAILIPHFGFLGSPMATSCTRIVQFLMMVGIVYYYEHSREDREAQQSESQQSETHPLSSSTPAHDTARGKTGMMSHSSLGTADSQEDVGLLSGGLRSSSSGGGLKSSSSGGGLNDHSSSSSIHAVPAVVTGGVGVQNQQQHTSPGAKAGGMDVLLAGLRKMAQQAQHRPRWSVHEVLCYVWAQSKAACHPHTMWSFLKIGIPGGCMLAFEGAAFDVTTAFAGRLGTQKIAAHSAMLLIITLTFFSGPLPLATAASIRVGNLLGAGCHKTARLTGFISVSLGTGFMCCMGLLLFTLRNQLGYLYTEDEGIRYWMSVIAPIAALFQIFDGVMGTSQGVLRGCGRQHQLMFINLFGFWLFGVVIGALLCFKAGMGLRGLWWGILAGLVVTAILTFGMLLFVDWEKEAKIAKQRSDEQQALDALKKGEGGEGPVLGPMLLQQQQQQV
ncbi:MAG: hypothetical protein WDW36_009549 [Sanguina aurantia]